MTAPLLHPDTLTHRDWETDRATVTERIERFRERQADPQPKLIVPTDTVPQAPEHCCVPEVAARDLDAATLKSALAEHGALIARGFFSAEELDGLTAAADRVIDACLDPAQKDQTRSAFYSPPENLRTIMPNGERELGNTRTFHRESGSAMCVESPTVAEALLRLYETKGLKDLITQYLGEPPCLSVKKWVLRRSKLPVAEAGWHQDGAFMGTDINSINMWLPLSRCGGTTGAPGMDMVPRRINAIASAEGAQFDWSVSDALVGDEHADNGPVAPVFEVGDAFFFDHFYLHRTQFREDFTALRYAVETWFFGESAFPKNQIPLAW
jgi:hypothetical protein